MKWSLIGDGWGLPGGRQETLAVFPWQISSGSVLHGVPSEICAGRLAEAAAQTLKGLERLGSAPVDREGRWFAGAPEPKQIGEGILYGTERQDP